MLTGWRLTLSKCFVIPQRYVLGLMGFLAVVNAYMMRVCLSVAISAMARFPPGESTGSNNTMDTCPAMDTGGGHGGSSVVGEFVWDSDTRGLILSSFFWGYVVTHMPGGILAEKFGGKHTLGLGILGTAVFTLLTPVAVKTWDWPGLVAVRVIEGLGEGTTFPALNALLAKWVPSKERAKIGTLVYAGGQIGTVVGNAISGALIKSTGQWESVFYLFGSIGVVWFVLWTLLCYSNPNSHPFISDSEKKFLDKEIGSKAGHVEIEIKTMPWKAMATSLPLWGLVVAQIGHDWGFFTMVTDLPTYMNDVLKYDIDQNGILSSVPYIVMWCVSMFSAWLCDWMINRGYISTTRARKMFTTIASMGPAIFIIAASYAGCDRTVVIVLFCIGMGLMGTFYPGMKVNGLDLASNYAGTVMAIVNGVGAITGIITPILVGKIATNHTISEWRIVFWIAFGVFLCTNLVFVIIGSGEEQWWNNSNNSPPNKKEKESKLNTISIVNK